LAVTPHVRALIEFSSNLLGQVHKETMAGREKAAELKQRRQEQAVKNRERLKAAFLKKQAQKLRTQGTPV
jgi:hypothetical protein